MHIFLIILSFLIIFFTSRYLVLRMKWFNKLYLVIATLGIITTTAYAVFNYSILNNEFSSIPLLLIAALLAGMAFGLKSKEAREQHKSNITMQRP